MEPERRCKACNKVLVRKAKEPQKRFEERKNCDVACARESRGKEQSPETPYKSRFSTKWVSPAEYLAENMVSRIARKEQQGQDLPMNFWRIEKWERHYRLQLRFALSLLKMYSDKAIINALKTNEGQRVFSLSAQWLDPIIRDEQTKIDRRKPPAPPPAPAEPAPEPKPEPSLATRPAFVPKTTLSKLKNL